MDASQKPVWMTSVTTPDTSPSLDAVLRPLTEGWRRSLADLCFGSGLDSLTIVVHLTNPPVPGFREKRSYNGDLNMQFCTVGIEFPAWRDADAAARLRILEGAVARAVDGAPERRVTAVEKMKLAAALRAAVMELQSTDG